MRTAASECEHNLVDGEAVLRFTLTTLCQVAARGGNREKLQALLEERARRDVANDKPHEADFPAALMALGWRDRAKVLRDMWRFVVLYKEFNWGRQIFREMLQRPMRGGYSMQRWL